jgi:uncharacterized protein YbjT (DUF2867 family)
MFLGASIFTGDLALPADGPTAWASRVDLAEGIARLMLQREPLPLHVTLTGPEAIDFASVAVIASRTVGRTILRRIISGPEFAARLAERGFPPPLAQSLASGFASRAAGDLSDVDPALERLLGRPRRRVVEVLPELLARIMKVAAATS